AVRKPRPPIFTPRIGVRTPATRRAAPSIVPSPPKTINKSLSAASDFRSRGERVPSSGAVVLSTSTERPWRSISRATRLINCRAAAFSGLVVRPTRWIVSLRLFKQHEKFFVAGRSEQGRFDNAAPRNIRQCFDKLPQLINHALVYLWICNHSLTLVDLRF